MSGASQATVIVVGCSRPCVTSIESCLPLRECSTPWDAGTGLISPLFAVLQFIVELDRWSRRRNMADSVTVLENPIEIKVAPSAECRRRAPNVLVGNRCFDILFIDEVAHCIASIDLDEHPNQRRIERRSNRRWFVSLPCCCHCTPPFCYDSVPRRAV